MPAFGQSAIQLDWRSVGNWAIEAAAPVGLSSGPVNRVWFSGDGASLYAALPNGKTVETKDFEAWKLTSTAPAPTPSSLGARNWQALTEFRGFSIIGGAPADATISPIDDDDLVVANAHGIWRSLDGGESWTGLNNGLPNFPGRRILGVGNGSGARVLLEDGIREARWQPGERHAWRVVPSREAFQEGSLAAALEQRLGARPSRIVAQDGWIYAGVGSKLMVSSDAAATWRASEFPGAMLPQVASIFLVPGNPRLAFAALGGPTGTRLVRTMNGGIFWDDITANLPAGSVNGVTADLETGAIYAATQSGLFTMTTDLRAAAPAATWTQISTGSNSAAVVDVALGPEGHQLWILLDKAGLRRALAPHRALAPKIVSGADGTTRLAAPGGLLSVLGAKIAGARVGTVNVPVLAASDTESQLQLPFSLQGSSVTLSLEGAAARSVLLPLAPNAPAIFTDGDGSPMLIDADRGSLIDTSAPARPGTTIQILAAGLGRVSPDWPAGAPAPVDAPKVVSPVKAWLDRVPVEVTRATLAPGYAGLYLVEIEVPVIINPGPNELYLEMNQTTSNRVMLHVGR